MPGPVSYVKVLTTLERINEVLAVANETGEQVLGIVDIINGIEDALGIQQGDITTIKTTTDELAAADPVDLSGIEDRLGALEVKVSTIQRVLTGLIGFSSDDSEWPTLDLRPTADNIPRWYPVNSRLIEWLNYAALATVPTDDATTALLAHIDAPATIPLLGARGVTTIVTVEPVDFGGSNHLTASVVEFLGYFSWRALGAFTAPEKINHRDQLWIPRGFTPDAVAIEPRPGVEFDIRVVIPNLKLL